MQGHPPVFKTLWAKVIETLNKGDSNAMNQQLAQIIERLGPNQPQYPYKPLPNVKEFTITKLHPHDPKLKDHGIMKRLKDAEFETKPYKNKSMNRYVKIQFTRLSKSLHNPSKF